jgi:hypothetical protein
VVRGFIQQDDVVLAEGEKIVVQLAADCFEQLADRSAAILRLGIMAWIASLESFACERQNGILTSPSLLAGMPGDHSSALGLAPGSAGLQRLAFSVTVGAHSPAPGAGHSDSPIVRGS